MEYTIFRITNQEEDSASGVDKYLQTLPYFPDAGWYVYDFQHEKLYLMTQNETVMLIDNDEFLRAVKENSDVNNWNFLEDIPWITTDIDYPKKSGSSDSTDEPTEEVPPSESEEPLGTVHAHINSLKPDHVVVGDDDNNEIYSLTRDIGDEFTPVYIKQGVITEANNFRRGVKEAQVSQDIDTVTVRLINQDLTTTDFKLLPGTSNNAGLITPNQLRNIESIKDAVDNINHSVDTKIVELRSDIEYRLNSIPNRDQVSLWAAAAAETALINGFASTWSAIARQITLDKDGNIIAINGAGFITDNSFSEMFAGYMDVSGKEKFASIVAEAYKDELGDIETRIKASADKIYLTSYKEAALGVFDANKETLISGLIANNDFMSLVYENIETGTSGSITIQDVLNYNYESAESKTISQILLDANEIATSENTQILKLLARGYNSEENIIDSSGIIAYPDMASMFVSREQYTSDQSQINEELNKVSGVFVKNDGDSSVIYLDADKVMFRDTATIGTYIGSLAKYEYGRVTLNPIQLRGTEQIGAILSNEVTFGNETATLGKHINNIKTSVTNLQNGEVEITTVIDADRVIIGRDTENPDLDNSKRLSDALEVYHGEITCKAATYTEGQRTIFKTTDSMTPTILYYVGMPEVDINEYTIEGDKTHTGYGFCVQNSINPYWYGEDKTTMPEIFINREGYMIDIPDSAVLEEVEIGPSNSAENLYYSRDIWEAYSEYCNNNKTHNNMTVRWNGYGSYPYSSSVPDSEINYIVSNYSSYYYARLKNMATWSVDFSKPGLNDSLIKLEINGWASNEFYILESTNVAITGKNVILPCREDWVGRKVILTSLISGSSYAPALSLITTEKPSESPIVNISPFWKNNDDPNVGCGDASMIGIFEGIIELCYLPRATVLNSTFQTADYCWFITNFAGKRFSVYKGNIKTEEQLTNS